LEQGIAHISLFDPYQVLPKRQRKRDEFIMEWLVQQMTLSQGELISCNHCCRAMEAVTLADIVTGDGKQIRDKAWSCSHQQLLNCHSLIFWALGLLPHTAAGNGFIFPLTARFTTTLLMFGTVTFLPLNIPPSTGPSPTAT
jgi:hypothetical protein